MHLDDLLGRIDAALRPLAPAVEPAESYETPRLDVVRSYSRPVRLSWVPLIGRALSVVTVARQPADLGASADDTAALLDRVATVANRRYPPWRGLSLCLCVMIVATEPVRPEDDAALASALDRDLARQRAVPLAIFRVNPDQEALAYALRPGPGGLFPDGSHIADALTACLRRFVPLVEM
jgi:hypothetical protein